jgi:hypothetical protein
MTKGLDLTCIATGNAFDHVNAKWPTLIIPCFTKSCANAFSKTAERINGMYFAVVSGPKCNRESCFGIRNTPFASQETGV